MTIENDDSAIAVAACLSACVAAYGVYLGLPLILGALATTYGFSNAHIGWIGAAENAGLLIGSVTVSALGRSLNFKTLAYLGIAVAASGDAITIGVHTVPVFCMVRLFAGFGGGLCYSAAIAALSLTRQATRNFSVFIVVLTIANSVELWTIPGIVSLGGVRGLYAALGCLYLVPLVLIRHMPVAASAPPRAAVAGPANIPVSVIPASMVWSCLSAVVLFNVAASAFWAYSERIGASVGMSERAVSHTLTICNLISVTGSMLAYALHRRWGQHRPQLGATAVMIMTFAVWSVQLSPTFFGIGTLLFFEVWTMVSVFQLGTVTAIDSTGRRVALIPAAQGIGQSAGPFIAAALLGMQFNFSQMLLAVDLFALGSFVLYAVVYARLRRFDIALANR
jgi:predicted MFS family arabinose efflux permease